MSGPIRRFDPGELRSPGEPEPTVAESADALAAARELEALAMDTSIRPSDGFEDRVMAAIASEPAPRLVLLPAASVRGGRLGAFLVAVRQSWAIATTGGRPVAVRAQALAFVLLVIVAAGALTSVTAVGVGALLGPNGSTTGPDRSPNVTSPSAPVASPDPTASPESTATPAATETPEPTETPPATGTARPTATETPEPTETPPATRTARPTATGTETPEPTETPEGSDDDGGGDGPGRGGGGSGSGGSGSGGKGPG